MHSVIFSKFSPTQKFLQKFSSVKLSFVLKRSTLYSKMISRKKITNGGNVFKINTLCNPFYGNHEILLPPFCSKNSAILTFSIKNFT